MMTGCLSLLGPVVTGGPVMTAPAEASTVDIVILLLGGAATIWRFIVEARSDSRRTTQLHLPAERPTWAETTRICPVCPGVELGKILPAPGLILDSCGVCGGIWFECDEVSRLRDCQPSALWSKVSLKPEGFRYSCPGCGRMVERNAEACRSCERPNVLVCPRCRRPLRATPYDKLRLDVCLECRAVWFDNVELSEIWNTTVDRLARRARVRGAQVAPAPTVTAEHFILGDFLLADSPASRGGEVSLDPGAAISAAGDLVGGLPSVAGDLVDATGRLAGDVFDAVGRIVGDLFDGDLFDGDFFDGDFDFD